MVSSKEIKVGRAANWGPDLPHMDVRLFLYDELRKAKAGSELDEKVCRLLGASEPPFPPVTTDLGAAIKLIPEGWWWHISHLGVDITPTTPAPGMPVSNAGVYDAYGRPLQFHAMLMGNRQDLPRVVCEAMLMARYDLPAAFVVCASARQAIEFETKSIRERQRQIRSTREKH